MKKERVRQGVKIKKCPFENHTLFGTNESTIPPPTVGVSNVTHRTKLKRPVG